MLLQKHVVLSGMMGTGKSWLGAALAQHLRVDFVDVDAAIVAHAGQTVPQIFEAVGEVGFREIESFIINSLLKNAQVKIVALGGGAMISAANRAIIKESSYNIWLQSDIDVIYERIKDDANRPLLQVADPKSKLVELLAARQSFYAEADFVLENNGASLPNLVAQIDTQLQKIGLLL